MRYEKPEWEVIRFNTIDVITQSGLDEESSGGGDNFGGDGKQPWE